MIQTFNLKIAQCWRRRIQNKHRNGQTSSLPDYGGHKTSITELVSTDLWIYKTRNRLRVAMKQVKWIYFDKHCEIMQKINGRTQPFRFSVFTVGRHEIFVENIGNSCAKNHRWPHILYIFGIVWTSSITAKIKRVGRNLRIVAHWWTLYESHLLRLYFGIFPLTARQRSFHSNFIVLCWYSHSSSHQ